MGFNPPGNVLGVVIEDKDNVFMNAFQNLLADLDTGKAHVTKRPRRATLNMIASRTRQNDDVVKVYTICTDQEVARVVQLGHWLDNRLPY